MNKFRHGLLLAAAVASLSGAATAQLTILNMHDTDSIAPGGVSPFTPNYVRDAAAQLGASLTVVTSQAAFNTAFDTMGPWDVVIYSAWTNGQIGTPELDRLVTQATAGRKAIVNAWNIYLSGLQSHAFFTSIVPCTMTGDYTSALDLHVWDSTNPVWTTPRVVSPTPLVGTTHPTWNRDGQFASPVGGSIAPGGYGSSSPSPNNAGIIIGFEGKAIFNTFTPQQYPQGSMVDLYIDEIEYNASRTQCVITSPMMVAMVSGNVDIIFDASDTEADPITSTFEWSTDGGITWQPATAAPGSPFANPDVLRPSPISMGHFTWASFTDGVGTTSVVIASFRVTVSDGTHGGNCSLFLQVDNQVPPPMCSLVLPMGTASNDVMVGVDASSVSSPTVAITLEFSTDSGTTFANGTMAASSPSTNPAVGVPTGISNFLWDSRADGVALGGPASVVLRATVNDGVASSPAICLGIAQIDNSQICGICGDCNQNGIGPDVIDALTAAQIAVGLIVPTFVQSACCDVNTSGSIDVVDALVMAQSAAGLSVVLMCL